MCFKCLKSNFTKYRGVGKYHNVIMLSPIHTGDFLSVCTYFFLSACDGISFPWSSLYYVLLPPCLSQNK